jgi:hypothetical protein
MSDTILQSMPDTRPANPHVEFTIRVRWLVLALICVSAVLILLTALYNHSNESVRPTITFGCSMFAAAMAVAALVYNAEVNRTNKKTRQSEAAARLMERWNQPAFIQLRFEWRTLLSELDDHSDPVQKIGSDLRNRYLVIEMLAFFEEVAIAVDTESANEEMLNRFFGYHIPRAFMLCKPWVDHYRNVAKASDYYCEVDKLVTRWRDKYGGF